MGPLFQRLASLLGRLRDFFKRHRCLRALFVMIFIAVVAAIGALFFVPDKVRELTLKINNGSYKLAQFLPATLPAPTKIDKAYWLTQNWTPEQRFWFHHTSQGTATIPVPYVWFLALERPELTIFRRPGYIRDEEYMRRLGFIPSPSLQTLQRDASQYGYTPGTANDGAARDRLGDYPDNGHALPVGFARLKGGADPTTGDPYPDRIGFTCAACHTGHLEYKNVSIRFDGGPAMVNLGELERAIGLSIAYTLIIPTRFNRFANAVEALGNSPVDKDRLKTDLKEILQTLRAKKDLEDEILHRASVDHIDEGFGRLDALNRIGNQVFFANLLPAKQGVRVLSEQRLADNFSRHDAPVSFPPIWNTPFFLWAQYDASVLNELVRNAGEALGVSAILNSTMHSQEHPRFRSSIQLQNIYKFEEMLRGPDPFANVKPEDVPQFKGLIAPKWSEAAAKFPGDPAWSIDDKKVETGRELYRTHCFECHRGPVVDPKFEEKWRDASFWKEANPDRPQNWVIIDGRRYFNVVQKPVAALGTDRQQSRVLTERRLSLPATYEIPMDYLNKIGDCKLSKDGELTVPFVLALMAVVDQVIDQWFVDNQTPPDVQKQMRGPRRNCQNTRVFELVRPVGGTESTPPITAVVPHYRARPLDGAWATAPYLHNGSVPTLYDMLTPQDQRPTTFCVGSREFDPGKVGVKTVSGESCEAGLTRFDTRQLGNSNLGHSFQGIETDMKKFPPGVIGRGLTPNERDSLVEYLKTL